MRPTKKEVEVDKINPKQILRTLLENLPEDDGLARVLLGLYAYSDTFWVNEVVEKTGKVIFKSDATKGQLAAACKASPKTIYNRLKKLQAGVGNVSISSSPSNHPNRGNDYVVSLTEVETVFPKVKVVTSVNPTEAVQAPYSKPTQVNEACDSGNSGVPTRVTTVTPSGVSSCSGVRAITGVHVDKAQSLRSDEQHQEQEQRQEQPRPEWIRQIDENDSPSPVNSPAPQAIAAPPAPPANPRIVRRASGHRFVQTYNGRRCIACKIHFATYQREHHPCPYEEMEMDAVEDSRPEEKKERPQVGFRNPIHTHDWSQDRNVCARCGAERTEVNFMKLSCEQKQSAPAAQGQDSDPAAPEPTYDNLASEIDED